MPSRDDKELVSEFADAIREAGGAQGMADSLAEMNGWAKAFQAAIDTADPENAGAVAVVRSIYAAALARRINMMWPLRFGEIPQNPGDAAPESE